MNDFSIKPMKLGSKCLIANEYGNYVILSKEEYLKYTSQKPDKALFAKLEANDIIITKANRQRAINRYRDSKKQIFQGTSLHIIIPTRRCNLSCIYCHSPIAGANELQYDMQKKTAEKTVDFIFQSPAKNITIEYQGGEPLLNFNIIKETVLYAKKLAKSKRKLLKFTIVTNLAAMDEEKMLFLLKQEVWPCISLDGPKKLQDKNRPNSYKYIQKWAPLLQKKTNGMLSGICIITRESLKYSKEILEAYKQFGFKKIWIQPFHALGSAKKNYARISYTAKDYIAFWKKTITHIIEKKIPLQEISSTFLLRKLIKKENPLYVDLQSPCGAVINQLAYEYDGSIYSCDEGRMVDSDIFKVGSVDMKYTDVVKSPESCSIIGMSVNDLLFCCKCAFKPFCGVCPVIAFASNKTPIPKPDNFECKILKAQFTFLLEKYYENPDYRRIFEEWISTKDL
jgi:His-Xaa-Ser system radical SAM maturase HxsB